MSKIKIILIAAIALLPLLFAANGFSFDLPKMPDLKGGKKQETSTNQAAQPQTQEQPKTKFNFLGNGKEAKTKTTDSIPLKVDKVDSKDQSNPLIHARLKEITNEGKTKGIDKMVIEGKIIETKQQDKEKIVTIIWQKANYQQKSVDLSVPLQSKIAVKEQVKKGDIFSAKGDSAKLTEAWERLQNPDPKSKIANVGEKKNEDKKNSDVSSSSRDTGAGFSGGASTNAPIQQLPTVAPNYSATETITTSEGCDIRVDLVNNIAVQQQRSLQGDKEISPCADSQNTFPLEKSYDECPDYIDYKKGKVFKQFNISYNNSKLGGKIQIQACKPDLEQSADIIDDYENCEIRHDFKNKFSVQQRRTIYFDSNGATIILQNCYDDNEKKYFHEETSEGCKDVVDGNNVIWSTRKFINVGGDKQFISLCEPKSNNLEIHEEACKSKPYTNDFVTNQSFVNKDYFYYKDNKKVLIQECIKSTEVLPHKDEISDCTITNNDQNKTSQIEVKTYIEDQGNKFYIKDCHVLGVPVQYTKTGSKWLKQQTQTGKFTIITPNLDRLGLTDLGGNHNVSYDMNIDICYRHDRPDVWNLTDGRDIDEENSDEFVKYDFHFNTPALKYGFMYQLACLDPHCTAITDLNKHSVYTRYDGSVFIDKSQLLDRKVVCGFGHLIDGREEGI